MVSTETFKAQFHGDWDLLRFLEERRGHGLNDDLSSVFTITGNTQAAQLETVAKFVRQTWSTQFDALLPALQKAISVSYGKMFFLAFLGIPYICT